MVDRVEVIMFSFGALLLITGVVILIRKGYFDYNIDGQFVGKVSGKKAKSQGIEKIIMGLFFMGLAVALYLLGN